MDEQTSSDPALRSLQDNYPDPTEDEADPYPVLNRHDSVSSRSSFPRHSGPASQQYSLLANTLHRTQASNTASSRARGGTSDDFEGAPLANAYLNLHPTLPDDDQLDDLAAETDIDGFGTDVEAVTGAINNNGTPKPKKKRKGGWKQLLKGTTHDPKYFKEKAPRAPRQKRKDVTDPGAEFKEKQVLATKAFIDQRLDEALEHARDAIHANPEVWAAHALLADILFAKGQEQDSLAALLSGAVTARDPSTWNMVADRTLHYAGDGQDVGILQQAIFCYTQAINLEKPTHRQLEARIAKMRLWLQLEEFSKARRDCKQLVAFMPDDLDLARQLAELCVMTNDKSEYGSARKSYEYALNQYLAQADVMTRDQIEEGWNILNVFVEMLEKLAKPEDAMSVLKRFARKLLGRGEESFWDKYTDTDCELDLDHARRYEIIEFQQGRASRDRLKYGESLPLELRVKLGIFRLEAKQHEENRFEALRHFDQLMQYRDEIEDTYEMFYVVAMSLAKHNLPQDAIRFFEPIQEIEDAADDEYWLAYGRCLRDVGRFGDSADALKKGIALNPSNLAIKVDLAHLYQNQLHEKEQAWKIVDDIVAMNKKDILRREKLTTRPPEPQPKQSGKPTATRYSRRRKLQRRLEEMSQGESSDEEDIQFVHEKGSAVGNQGRPKKMRKLLKKTSFTPAGPGQQGGFSLADLDAGLPVAELERQRKEIEDASDYEDSGGDEDSGEFDELDYELSADESGRLWRQKHKPAKRKRQRKQKHNLEELAGEVYDNHRIVKDLWSTFEGGVDTDAIQKWMAAAHGLYEVFRHFKQFYPSRDKGMPFKGFLRLEPGEVKFMNDMESWKKSLEGEDDEDQDEATGNKAPSAPDTSVPKDFYGIPFSDWHHIFTDMVLWYARKSHKKICYQILDDGIFGANVFFHDPELLNTTQATSFCCGFIFNDSERLCFAARWFINKHDFRSAHAYQLLAGVNRLSHGSNLWFSAGPMQKHMLRALKALDYHYMKPAVRKKFDWSLQTTSLKKRVDKYGEDAARLDATALMTYGHMVGVANHSQSALPYFFRAYALEPGNITINLSIATMYIQNAMKRQTDNRQYGVLQGLSFLSRYYELRTAQGGTLEKQEAEFNVGRTWHMLGLTHLAVKHYQQAMALSEAVQAENKASTQSTENFAREAAFAMVTIYALSGNDEAARQVTEEWLVL